MGVRYWRFYRSHHTNPLGWDVTAQSRFSCPKRRNFAVVYGATSFTGAFVETIIRDGRDGIGSSAPVHFAEIKGRCAVQVEVSRSLTLVDLTGHNPINMGVPSDVLRWSKHHLGRRWSAFFHRHPDRPDGIIYPSRLDGRINVAVYNRAVTALAPVEQRPLLEWDSALADALDELEVVIKP